jgi:adenylate cyclase
MKDILRDVVSPLLARHGDRLVTSTGDGGLIEFQSVVESARWALVVQRQLTAANQPEPPSRRIEMRIGVSLGDIIIEPDDIYGEGVNLAARLQGVAEPGGICLTQHVVEQLRDGRDPSEPAFLD